MVDMDRLKEKLNRKHEGDHQQLSVIFTDKRRVIVTAPAGYGKTTTMISRIAYLFASGKIPNPKKVLGLTFSVNAALKIKHEIAENLPELMNISNNPNLLNEKITITNYHGFCKGVLKKYGYLITDLLYKDINLIRAISDTDVKKYRENGMLLSEKEVNILEQVDKCIKMGGIPGREEIESYNHLIIQKVLPFKYITHNAIILMTISLLSSFEEVRKFYQNYYPLLIVDEFQDTNRIAWELLQQLISPKSQLLFLGDPLQRIYGFIGALPNIMYIAEKRYNMQAIKLLTNYRFRKNQDMLNLDFNIRANADEHLELQQSRESANLPAFYGDTQEMEANFIASKVLALQQNEPNCKIAILCRGRNKNSEVLENILIEQGISYFYGMFTDEDPDYVDFHIQCYNMFFQYFGNHRKATSYLLKKFVEKVQNKYAAISNKITTCLLALLDALMQKVLTDYALLSAEDKYLLILDTFENRQLKQAMEYVDKNIIISTIHGAKGLEWDYVFIMDVEPWIFPNYFTCKICPNRSNSYSKHKISIHMEEALKNKLIDELSIFYVGITRAKKQVYISASKKRYDGKGNCKRSNFSCLACLPGIQLVSQIETRDLP